MNAPFVLAQATGVTTGQAPTQTIKLTKPTNGQAVTVDAGNNGSVLIDFSAIANEKITLVHVGDKLVILFDNQSTLTIEPFYDSSNNPLANLTVEVAPGQDLSGTQFASTFPITDDQSVLPAAGGAAGAASGANFSDPSVDPFSVPTPLPLLGPETLGNFVVTFDITPNTDGTTAPFLTGATTAGAVDEGGLTSGTIGDLFGTGNDPGFATVVSGTVSGLVNFGTSGPSTITAPFQFVGTTQASNWIANLHLTSHGSAVDAVTISINGNTETLIAGTSGPGAHEVFSLTLNVSGQWTFTLINPLDEPNPGHSTPGAAVEDVVALDLSGLVLVTAANGDSGTLANDFTVTVTDDVPVIASGTSTGTTDEGGLVLGTPGDLYGSGNDFNAATSATGSVAPLVKFGADGPDIVNGVQEGFQFVSQQSASAWLATLGQTSHGSAVDVATITVSGNVETLTASAADGHEVFTLSLDQGTGQWTFTLINPLDDPNPGHLHPGPAVEDSVTLDLSGLVQAVDFDGDSVGLSNDFNVTVIDDVPVLIGPSSGTFSVGAVDEGGLTSGTPGDLYGTGNDPNAPTSESGSVSGLVSFGADGPDVVGGTQQGFQFVSTASAWLAGLGLTSHGMAIDTASVVTVGSTETLTASTSGLGAHEVFTLALDESTGDWTFTLINPLDHPDPGHSSPGSAVEDTLTLDLSGLVQAVDFDGDSITLSGGFSVTVIDDVPVATGNLIQNGTFAAGNFSPESYGGVDTDTTGGGGLDWLIGPSTIDPPSNFGANVQLERVNDGYLGEFTPDGHFMVDLEASPGNITIFQTVSGIVAGETYTIGFLAGGPEPSFAVPHTAELLVFWGGVEIADIHPGLSMQPYDITVTGGANAAADTLVFEEVGVGGDLTGTYLADVVMLPSTSLGIVDEGGLTSGSVGDQFGTGNDPGAATVASGSLADLVSFGADGPDIINNQAAGFSLVSSAVATAWLTGLGITSHGAAVDTVTIVGNTLTASTDPGQADPHTVFTLTVNGDGTWTFTLVNPLDDATPGHATPGPSYEDSLPLDLSGLVQATDFDGDTISLVSGSFQVSVIDDVPVLMSNTVSGTVDEGALKFSLTTGDLYGFGNDLLNPHDHVVASGSLGSLVSFGADGPYTVGATSEGFQFVTNASAWLAGLGLTSHGSAVDSASVSTVGNTETLTASAADAHEVFTLSLNEGTGAWTFTLINPLDDANPGHNTPGPAVEDSVSIDLSGLVQAVDYDGDSVTLSSDFNVIVVDDVPVLNPFTLPSFGLVAEGALSSPPDLYGTGNGSIVINTVANGSLAPLVLFGADGPDSVDPASSNPSGGFEFVSTAAASTWLAGLGITSHGDAVNVASIAIVNGVETLAASTTSDPHDVFTLALNEGTGAWTFTLLNPLDDAPDHGVNSLTLDLSGLVQAIDYDGDGITLSNDFSVTVFDDVPVLTSNTATGSVDEGALSLSATVGDLYGDGNDQGNPNAVTVVSGSVSGLVSFGADGPNMVGGTAEGFQFISAHDAGIWLAGLHLTSHGSSVNTAAISIAGGVETLIAGTSGPNAHEVFSLTLDESTGQWQFTLINPFDEQSGHGENTLSINLSGLVQAVDFDDDAVTLFNDFKITVTDDVPVLVSNTVSVAVDEGALTSGTLGDRYGTGNDPADPNDVVVVSGSVSGLVSFGADGPQFVGSTSEGFQFVSSHNASTWLAGLGLTSHGMAINTASIVTASGVETLTASTLGAGAHEVFTLALDESTGAWTFTLINPLDQPAGNGENTSTIDLSGLVQAVDFDGDAVVLSNDFSVTVTDDVPVIVPDNGGPNQYSSGSVDEGGLASGTPGDLYGTGNDPGAAFVTSGSVAALVQFGADGPASVNLASTNPSGGFEFVSATAAGTWLGNLGLTSHGDLINSASISIVNGVETLTASTTAGAHEVFTLSLNEGTGAWIFTLINPLDQPAGNGENTSTLDLSGLVQGVDFDGDPAVLAHDLFVTVTDDVPVIVPDNGGPNQYSSGSVDEGGLASGTPGDLYGTGNDPGAAFVTSGSVAALVQFGADGPAGVNLASTNPSGGFELVSAAAASTWLGDLGLTSHGDLINSASISIVNGVETLTASTTAGAHEVFTLSLNEGTGAWTFTLINPLDQPAGNGENTSTLDLSGLVQGVDFDGDPAVLAHDLFVTVTDDVPVANQVTATMAENADTTVTLVSGTNYSFGADGPAATGSISFDTHDATITGPVGETFGTPTYLISGSSIEIEPGTAFAALTSGQTATLDIPYTITDFDGDIATNQLVVTVDGPTAQPPVVTPNLIIDADLATGQTNNAAGVEATANTFSIPAAALLFYDSDPQHLPLSITAVSGGGASFGNGGTDHNYILLPFTNSDTFTITVSDGISGNTTQQTFTVDIVGAPVEGTATNNILVENADAGQNTVGGAGSDVVVANTSGGSNDYGDSQFAPDIGSNSGNDLLIANNAPFGNSTAGDNLFGGQGNDVLIGGVGPDLLYGDLGSDTLTGGAGNNTFEYIKPTEGGDTITDFDAFVGQTDTIQISAGGFGGGLVANASVAPVFVSEANANFPSGGADRFLFDTANNGLYYSHDGTTASEVLLATVTNHTVTAGDIHVVA